MSEAAAPRARREYQRVLALLAAGGGLGLLASTMTWASAVWPRGSGLPAISAESVRGSDLVPLLPAAASVALAAVVAVVASRGAGRRLVGIVLVFLGGAAAVTCVTVTLSMEKHVRRLVLKTDVAGPEVDVAPVWALVAVLSGVAVLVAGLVVVWRGASWPTMGTRYERGPTADDGGDHPETSRERWDALDRGDDPTR